MHQTNKVTIVLSLSQVASCEGIIVCPAVTSDTHVVIGGGVLIDYNKACDRVMPAPLEGDALNGCNRVALCSQWW